MPGDRDLSSLSNVDPERLSRLWPQAAASRSAELTGREQAAPDLRPGTDGVQWEPSELRDVLRHQLAAPLDLRGDLEHAPGLAEAPVTTSPAPRPAVTLETLLNDRSPMVEVLRHVKEWAKPAMQGYADDLPREVAGVIYFAAIHAALSRCGERITHLPDGALRKGARWALRRPWLDPLCAEVLREGLAHLDRRLPEAEES